MNTIGAAGDRQASASSAWSLIVETDREDLARRGHRRPQLRAHRPIGPASPGSLRTAAHARTSPPSAAKTCIGSDGKRPPLCCARSTKRPADVESRTPVRDSPTASRCSLLALLRADPRTAPSVATVEERPNLPGRARFASTRRRGPTERADPPRAQSDRAAPPAGRRKIGGRPKCRHECNFRRSKRPRIRARRAGPPKNATRECAPEASPLATTSRIRGRRAPQRRAGRAGARPDDATARSTPGRAQWTGIRGE